MRFSDFKNNSAPPPAIPGLGKAIRVVRQQSGLFESLQHMRESWRESKGIELAYSAARPSKFRRTRNGLGGTADAHYFNEFEFWQVREYARDMDRNDVVVQAMLDRVLDNVIGDGFLYDPSTGDKKLDQELWERFNSWSTDPDQVDLAGKFDFYGLERQVLRTTAVDGDCALVPLAELSFQFFEGERLNSPANFDDVVHGIRVDPLTERPTEYYFTKAVKNQRKLNIRRIPASYADLQSFPARQADGSPNVLHIFDPARYTQNRGVTWFKTIFDTLGMMEDINFARLVQQQMVSCVAMFITRDRDYQWGSREEQARADGTTETFEELHPGLVARLRPGEKVEPFSPNVPNPDYLPYVKMMLRMIGMAFGLPVELIMYDTTDTTFHGYRGALDQARQGFRRRQKWLETYFHRKVLRVLHRAWLPELGIRSEKLRRQVNSHVWRKPSWPYIDPKVDAEADRVRLRNCLTSPRRVQAERNGVEWEDVRDEIIEDWSGAIEMAIDEANKLNEKIDDDSGQSKVTWREVLHLDAPEGIARQEKIQGMIPGQEVPPPAPAPKTPAAPGAPKAPSGAPKAPSGEPNANP